MAEARFCATCGAERAIGAGFCAACGQAFWASPVAADVSATPATGVELVSVDQGPAPTLAPQASPRIQGQSRAGQTSRVVAIVIGVLVVLAVGAVVWGVATTQTLTTTQSQLATANQQLAGTTADLTSSKAQVSQLGSDKGELTSVNGQLTSDKAQLTSDKAQLTATVAQLTDQVSKQTQCISALNANAAELQRISGLASTNFNRSAKGSAWAKADDAALTDYYNAYRSAFSGQLSTANSWIAKGNAAIKTKGAQVKIIDAATKKIEGAETALGVALAQSATTCGF